MTVEAYRPVARTIEQVVNDYLRERPTIMFADFQPNILMAIDAVKETEIVDESLRWGGPNIRTTIRRVAAGEFRNPDEGLRFQFADNPRFRATLEAVYDCYRDKQGNPELARSIGTENIIIDACVADGISLADTQSVLDKVAEDRIWKMLPKSAKHLEHVQQNAKRELMVAEMTSGGSRPFSLRTPSGNSRRYDPQGREVQFSGSGGRRFVSGDEGFAGMGDEQIKSMYDQWKQEQTYKSMSTEELRQQVRQQGQQRYENRFHADPTTGKPTAPVVATVQLIDPRDGSVIDTKTKLVKHINSSRYATAQLLQRNGKVDPELAREFERILNGR